MEDFMYVPLANWPQYDFTQGLLDKFQAVLTAISAVPSSSSGPVLSFLQTQQNMSISDIAMREFFSFLQYRDEKVLQAATTKVDAPFCLKIYYKYKGYTSVFDKYSSIISDDEELYASPYTAGSDNYLNALPSPYMVEFKQTFYIPFRHTGSSSEEQLQADVANTLDSFIEWFNSQFGLDDLVKGEPYSLPPANAETAAIAILGGVQSYFTSQIIPIGTFAMQLLEQYQMQKINCQLDIQFQLIIAIFKLLAAGLDPKGDLSEIMTILGPYDTGLPYRAKVNDYWLNQSIGRALNSFTNESEYPLDTPSVEKVVAEKTDLLGVQYCNFKKLFPFKTVSDDIFYLSEEATITPWPKQFFYIPE